MNDLKFNLNYYKIVNQYCKKISKDIEKRHQEHVKDALIGELKCNLAMILTSLELYYPDAHETIIKAMEL